MTGAEAADSRPVLARREIVGRLVGWGLLVLVAAWLLVNLVAAPQQFADVAVAGVRVGALYALIALGYTLIYGIVGLINVAHGDIFMLASVFTAIIMGDRLAAETRELRSWVLLAAVLPVVMAAAAAISAGTDRVAYRRLRSSPRLAGLVTAVGFSFIFQWLGLALNGSGQRVRNPIIPEGGLVVGPVTIAWSTVVVSAVTLPLLGALSLLVRRTRFGKAMRATAQDRETARLMGIDIDRVIGATFALGGALAGAAGLLYYASFGNTNYSDGFQFGLIAFTAAVLGGVGNLPGAVLGGVLIGLIQAFNDGLPYGLGQAWSQSVVFLVLILLMVFRPEGILGSRVVEGT
jgi:branched-chain amino acid transport system permease protein